LLTAAGRIQRYSNTLFGNERDPHISPEVKVRKVVVSELVTLDGVIEDPGGGEGFEHAGWAFKFNRGPEGDQFKFDEVMKADALLLGRVTYQEFAQVWPSMSDAGGFADKMNSMLKFVVSTNLEKADWNNSTVITGDVAQEVSSLKQQPGGDILINGSARLVNTLMEHGLIDEYRLMVFPVVLGSGKRIFGETGDKKPLRLTDSRTVGDGVAILVYEPAR
jgi:dihydrofolate reductase